MGAYQVEASDGAESFVIATTDRASEAIKKFADALERHRRAWVTDETGLDVSMEDLVALARNEIGG